MKFLAFLIAIVAVANAMEAVKKTPKSPKIVNKFEGDIAKVKALLLAKKKGNADDRKDAAAFYRQLNSLLAKFLKEHQTEKDKRDIADQLKKLKDFALAYCNQEPACVNAIGKDGQKLLEGGKKLADITSEIAKEGWKKLSDTVKDQVNKLKNFLGGVFGKRAADSSTLRELKSFVLEACKRESMTDQLAAYNVGRLLLEQGTKYDKVKNRIFGFGCRQFSIEFNHVWENGVGKRAVVTKANLDGLKSYVVKYCKGKPQECVTMALETGKKLLEGGRQVAEVTAEIAKNGWKKFSEVFKDGWNKVKDFFGKIFGKRVVLTAAAAAAAAAKMAAQYCAGQPQTCYNAVKTTAAKLLEGGKKVSEVSAEIAKNGWKKFSELFKDGWNKVKDFFGKIFGKRVVITTAAAAAAATQIATMAAKYCAGQPSTCIGAVEETAKKLYDGGKKVAEISAELAKTGWKQFSETFKDGWNAVKDFLGSIFGKRGVTDDAGKKVVEKAKTQLGRLFG